MRALARISLFILLGVAPSGAASILSTSFSSSDSPSYSDGNLPFQNGWLGQTATQVTDAAGAGIATSGAFTRNTYGGLSAHGGSGGAPVVAAWAVGDSLRLEVDYQFTLGNGTNDNLARFGFRDEGPNAGNGFEASPTIGLAVQFNQFNANVDGGGVKFWGAMQDENLGNVNALILSGHDMGIDPLDVLGNGVDFVSDFLRVNWEATYTGSDTWDVTGLSVENLATSSSFTYTGPTRSFNYTGGDAFFAMQLARSSKGSLGAVDAVSADFTPIPEPASLVLLGLGLAGLAARRRR